ncbi:MAG: DNA-formamidopyrimidine glycosylase family protein [bacterium]
MPELPFVTVAVENLAPLVIGRTVEDVVVRGVSVLKTFEPSIAELRGRQIFGVRRRAKLLILDISGDLGGSTAPSPQSSSAASTSTAARPWALYR